MQLRIYPSNWNQPAYLRGFWIGFGRFVGGGFFFFCLLFPFSGSLTLSLEGVLMGSGFWAVLAALYGASEGDAAVKASRAKTWQRDPSRN